MHELGRDTMIVLLDLPSPTLINGTAQVHVEGTTFYSFSESASGGLCIGPLPAMP